MKPKETLELAARLAGGPDPATGGETPGTGELRSPMALLALLLAMDLLRREAARPGWPD
ncbi:MAG: hypothetical protein IPP47_23650 [Bryobacterales bacterium]|nr:hypothetical protein [Bryobacterales bacterium]